MEGVSLARSGSGDHRNNHEDTTGSRVSSSVVVVGDLGENSNGSSNEGTTGSREEDVELMGIMSTSSKELPGRIGSRMVNSSSNSGSHHTYHHRHNHCHNSSSSHNHRNNSRANYCQFETPADESRGTFPDDFDEELFISSGQLVESKNDPPQFDEEMDSGNPHNDINDALNLDTADHSESSDIEDMFNNSNNPSIATTTPTSSSSTGINNIGGGSFQQGRRTRGRTTKILGEDVCANPNFQLVSEVTVAAEGSRKLEEPMQEDLNARSSAKELVSHESKRLLVDESYNQEEPDEYCVNETEDKESNSLFSSSVRKRKWIADEPLPAKKPVTDDDAGTKYKILVSEWPPPPAPIELEEDFPDEETSSIAPSPSVSDTTVNPTLLEWLSVFGNWNPVERLTAINHLIQMSEPSEVRHMMRVIEPQFQRDFISLLPKELALYVLSFLEPKDLLQAAQTCRYWRILCDDSLLWKEKCREAGIGPFSAMALRIHNRRNRVSPSVGFSLGGTRTLCPGGNDTTCNSSCEPWKAAFLRQHNVEMNWRFQPIRPAKTLKGHDDHVITCLQFSANRIVSGSDDNTLKVWSATTGKCLRTLIGHTGGVWSSQMSGTTIVSGSTDRTLRVWNADTGACLHTLYGHTSTVRCMHLYDRKVVSGSRDATLRVWNVDSGECLHVLVGHLAAVRCVQYNGKIVVSGAYDYMVRVWDVEREECLHQLSGHTNRVYSLQFDGIHVVSGSLDTSIRVWDVQTGVCRHTLMGHQSLTSGMELRENLLVSGNADSTVKIWDINTGQCLLTLSGQNKHLSAVTCLQLINKFVITSSDDGTVKLWDISTGDFVRNLVTLTSGGSGGVVWRIRASETKLVCAVGSRNGTEETKLLVLDFDVDATKTEDSKFDMFSPIKCA